MGKETRKEKKQEGPLECSLSRRHLVLCVAASSPLSRCFTQCYWGPPAPCGAQSSGAQGFSRVSRCPHLFLQASVSFSVEEGVSWLAPLALPNTAHLNPPGALARVWHLCHLVDLQGLPELQNEVSFPETGVQGPQLKSRQTSCSISGTLFPFCPLQWTQSTLILSK